jgi:hypothetical protein
LPIQIKGHSHHFLIAHSNKGTFSPFSHCPFK